MHIHVLYDVYHDMTTDITLTHLYNSSTLEFWHRLLEKLEVRNKMILSNFMCRYVPYKDY